MLRHFGEQRKNDEEKIEFKLNGNSRFKISFLYRNKKEEEKKKKKK